MRRFVFQVTMTVTKKKWVEHPELRWNEGLKRSGFNFRVGLSRSRYPAIPVGSTYRRTYLTAEKANFNITRPGREMVFGSTFYLPFLIFPMRRTGRPGWPGKREELLDLMSKGFQSGIREYQE